VLTSLLPRSNIAGWRRRAALLPGVRITIISRRITALIGAGFNTTRRVLARGTSRQLVHELLHLTVDSIASTNGTRTARTSGTTGTGEATVVAPVTASLAIGTIAGHVASVATNATDNVGGEVALLGTVVLAMSDLTTVLASLVLVITESTVESRQLTKLVALELILTFGDGSGSLDNVVNQLLGLVHLLFSLCHDQTVEILLLVASVSGIRSAFSFLDGAFSTNGNLGARFGLHFLQGVSTRSYK